MEPKITLTTYPKGVTAKVDYMLEEGGIKPSQGYDLDVGMDMYTNKDALIIPGMISSTMISLGIKTQFNAYQFGMLITPRSVMAKLPLMMGNTIGVIEGTFTGELMLPLRSTFTGASSSKPVPHAIVYDTDKKTTQQLAIKEIDQDVLDKAYRNYARDMELLGYNTLPEENLFLEAVPMGTVFIPKGTRLVQAFLIPRYKIALNPVEQLKDTARGENGFGSTGASLNND